MSGKHAKSVNGERIHFSFRRPRIANTGEKVRNAAALVYQEDLQEVGKDYGDLIAYMDHLHVKGVCSPLHDQDIFTEEDVFDWCERHVDPSTGDVREEDLQRAPYVGKAKKAHVHVGVMLPGPKTAQQISEMFEGLLPIRPTMWEKIHDVTAFIRYCAHLDSPQKAQYSPFDIVGFGGVDMGCLMKRDAEERVRTVRDVYRYCSQNGITNYHTLVNVALNSDDQDWIACVTGRASFWNGYFMSLAAERREQAERRKLEESAKSAV